MRVKDQIKVTLVPEGTGLPPEGAFTYEYGASYIAFPGRYAFKVTEGDAGYTAYVFCVDNRNKLISSKRQEGYATAQDAWDAAVAMFMLGVFE